MKGGKVPAKLAQNVMTQRASLLDAQDSFRIQQKVVRLLNSSDALQCIGYIP